MPDLIQIIKDLSHKAAEDYLIFNKPAHDTLLELYYDGKIENEEILKRICEQVNQNIYLSLFHSDETDKTNIQFDLADYNTLLENIQTSENAMKDYRAPPGDFRSTLELSVLNTEPEKPNNKMASLNYLSEFRDSFKKFHSDIESVRTSEIQNAEQLFNKMAHETKLMVARGESIGDIAKIASLSVKNSGLEIAKLAAAYDLIHKELLQSGFNVKTEFTKISSMKINNNAEILSAPQDFALSLEKIAACDEMLHNLSKVVDGFNKIIN